MIMQCISLYVLRSTELLTEIPVWVPTNMDDILGQVASLFQISIFVIRFYPFKTLDQ